MRANPTTNDVPPGVLELPSDLRDTIVSFLSVRAMALASQLSLELCETSNHCSSSGRRSGVESKDSS